MKKYVFESLKFFCAAILCTILTAFASPSWGALPYSYTQLEYIESTGTQYIDTNIPNSDKLKSWIDFSDVSATRGTLFGGGNGVNGIDFAGSSYGWIARLKDKAFANTTIQNNTTFSDTITLTQNSITSKNFQSSWILRTDTNSISGTMRVFVNVKGNLHGYKLWTNDELVFDGIPAKRNSDGAIGLYDKVTGNLFVSKGSESFVAGPETCDGTMVNYTSATGTGVQNGTPTPTNPIEPVFYQQGNMVLRKVGDYADSYDATTGKITRRVGVKVLDGTENTINAYNMLQITAILNPAREKEAGWQRRGLCTHAVAGMATNSSRLVEIDATATYFGGDFGFTAASGKQWLRDQYAAGTPVTLYYPLAEPVEEDWPASYCETPIKIATTKYNESAFSPLNTALQNAISVVDTVVSNTITQAGRIATLQAQKQTRPNDIADDNEKCPAYKQCLLVEDENGTPHWYEIFDPIHEWYDAWVTAGKPAVKVEMDGSNYSFYNAFYSGDKTWRKTYIDGTTSTYDRPFDHATRCTNPSYNTETQKARPCYSEVGMFKTLGDGEWAEVYTSGDGTNSPVGVVYGTSKCTSVGGPNNYATANPTKFSELSAANQEKWAELPAPVGQAEREGYERANFKQCWCKVDGVGVPGADGNPANGSIYPVGSSAWVFYGTNGSAASCAYSCAVYCADNVRSYAGFRAVLFGM